MSKKLKNQNVKSELSVLLSFIVGLLLLPFRLVMFLFGREKFFKVMSPFILLSETLTSAKFTFYMILLNFFVFFVSVLFFVDNISVFILYPFDLLNPSRWFSFLTHGFLHANLLHLFGNLFALFIFGRIVEKELGFSRTAVVYFSALIFAGIFSSIINLIQGNNIGGLGASGALMGLVSAAILLSPFRITFSAIIPLPIMVLGWLMIYADLSGLFSGTNDGIGYAAHIGGFLSAFLLFFILRGEKKKLFNGLLINLLTLALFLGIYFLFLR